MKYLLSIVAGLAFTAGVSADPQATYINAGKVTNPVVDATNFVNRGQITVSSYDAPWDSQNTVNVTNIGTMEGSVGFKFDYVYNSQGLGYRGSLSNFVNTGLIEAFDGGGLLSFFGSASSVNASSLFGDDHSSVEIQSDNVRNTGSIIAGANGIISIDGGKVDLAGGTLSISPLGGGSIFSNGFWMSETNFLADLGIYDQGWSIGTTTNFFPGNLVFGNSWYSPFIRFTNNWGIGNYICSDYVALANPEVFVYSTYRNPTQYVYQVVAVQTTDKKLATNVKFIPNVYPYDYVQQPPYTAVLELSTVATDLFTQGRYTNSLYVIDQIATGTNYNLLENLSVGTFRPAPTIITRNKPYGFANGAVPNDLFDPSIFDNTTYSNRVVNNLYSAYVAQVDNLGSRLPDLPDIAFTSQPGRVEIKAKELNIERARIRGEGLISIKAENFTGSSKAIVDGPHLKLNLATTKQNTQITNLTRVSVERLTGELFTYSSSWTNVYIPTLFDPTDTNSPNIEIIFQLLMVDATTLKTTMPVSVHEFTMKGPTNAHVQIADQLNVTDVFFLETERATVTGALALAPGLRWDAGTVPSLLYLTNNGRLEFAEDAAFGADRPGKPYKAFVNRGSIQAFTHAIDADYFENSGFIASTQHYRLKLTNFCFNTVTQFTNNLASIGPIIINAKQGYLNGGTLLTDGDISLAGDTWKFYNSKINAPAGIQLSVSKTITDAGLITMENQWNTGRGVQLLGAASGDLLGTTIHSVARPFEAVDHVWASRDLGGTNSSAFKNNLALGRLILNGTNCIFRFSPSDNGRVMYVDILDLRGPAFTSLQDIQDNLYLAPGFKIYFGDVRGSDTSINAESLNGLKVGDGSLLWVRTYAGFRSGVDVPVRGENRTIRVNGALRESFEIDSDGDGVPNGFDDYPFDTIALRIAQDEDGTVTLSFDAAAGIHYELQFTENITNPDWIKVRDVYLDGEGRVEIPLDDPARAGTTGFYRLVYTP